MMLLDGVETQEESASEILRAEKTGTTRSQSLFVSYLIQLFRSNLESEALNIGKEASTKFKVLSDVSVRFLLEMANYFQSTEVSGGLQRQLFNSVVPF
jgi:hypothetical protein